LTSSFFSRLDIESANYPVLHRALSTVSANQTLANNQRNVLAKNYRRTSINDEIVTIDHNDADASFVLPNLFELPEEIRIRVMDSLVDTPTMVSLEETSRLLMRSKEFIISMIAFVSRTSQLVGEQESSLSETLSSIDQRRW
jgi:hypothetical protein